jgi:hypothetical protein
MSIVCTGGNGRVSTPASALHVLVAPSTMELQQILWMEKAAPTGSALAAPQRPLHMPASLSLSAAVPQ